MVHWLLHIYFFYWESISVNAWLVFWASFKKVNAMDETTCFVFMSFYFCYVTIYPLAIMINIQEY